MSFTEESFIKISPVDVQKMVDNGAILIDIREPEELDEVAVGAHFIPLSVINAGFEPDFAETDSIIFYCRSGRRTRINAEKLYLAAQPARKLYIVEGGIFAWKEQGVKLLKVEPKDDIKIVSLPTAVRA